MAYILQTTNFKMHFLEWILINILLNYVRKSPIGYETVLVQKMAWHWIGDKPLFEPKMV